MLPPTSQPLWQVRPPLAGDAYGLDEALGSAADVPALGRSLAFHHCQPLETPRALRAFLWRYQQSLLIPIELPAIERAFHHASHYEVRELLAFDRLVSPGQFPSQFAFASQAVGRRYLRRLRPLRDVRLIRRYLDAIQHQQAHGWHTLVYGAALTIYSIPLRQGLLGYARQTLGGFLEAACRNVRLPVADRASLAAELWSDIPRTVDHLVNTRGRLVHLLR